MAIRIKQKLVAGVIFQFLLILLVGGFGIFYLMQLKNETRKIITNNYESLEYCHIIQQQLDSLVYNRSHALSVIEQNLMKQESNITEPGEATATGNLRKNIELLKLADKADHESRNRIHEDLQQIISLNMQAIQRKNTNATATAEKATIYISTIAGVVIIIALTFIFNFTSLFTEPINKLKLAIEAIAKKNYGYRVYIDGKDEFAQLANAFNDMAHRLNEYEHSNLNKLMFEKTRAEAVINSLQDAGLGISKDDKILFANEQALNILGVKAPDIVGKPVSEITAKNDLFRFLVEGTGNAPFKIVTEGKESYFIKDVNDIIINDTVAGRFYSIKNITTFREKDVAKTNFLATISHELKTPLASTDIGLKLLLSDKDAPLKQEQKEIVADLQKDNQRLLKLVSELLDLSQAETGNINLQITDVQPAEITATAINAMKQTASEKHIVLQMPEQGFLPAIKADKEKAVWVLMNLLSNAVKFSPEGAAVVIGMQTAGDDVSISVADKGPGIPTEYQQKIFERFFKVPGSVQFHKGTGLGLSISKEFMQAMGGRIDVESEPGNGTLFRLFFKHN